MTSPISMTYVVLVIALNNFSLYMLPPLGLSFPNIQKKLVKLYKYICTILIRSWKYFCHRQNHVVVGIKALLRIPYQVAICSHFPGFVLVSNVSGGIFCSDQGFPILARCSNRWPHQSTLSSCYMYVARGDLTRVRRTILIHWIATRLFS